jgi:hypothetical protein
LTIENDGLRLKKVADLAFYPMDTVTSLGRPNADAADGPNAAHAWYLSPLCYQRFIYVEVAID